jgi:PAS domain S-box-containing protein
MSNLFPLKLMKTKTTPRVARKFNPEIEELRAQLAEARDTLQAIRSGEVDALLVSRGQGDQVFTIQGADRPYRLLIEAMNEGALTVLHDGTILYCNRSFAEAVKSPIEKIIGGSFWRFIPSDQQVKLAALLKKMPEGGAKISVTLQTSGGQAVLPVQLSFQTLSVDGVNAIAVVATDLSERKRYEETLRQQNALLEQRVAERTAELTRANAALHDAQQSLSLHAQQLENQITERTSELRHSLNSMESFCYTIAHDLRAPLRTMHGFTAALLDEFGSGVGAAGHDYGKRIITAATRMDDLIRDLLAYGRISSAALPMVGTDLENILDYVIEQVRQSHQASNPEFIIQSPLPTVLANKIVLDQVFTNLLTNAVKFVATGVRPSVRIASQDLGERVRISVHDNGIGIAPEYFDRIFRVFERLDPHRYPGTGIGLAIVQKGIERMGGQVTVESQPGHGSTFSIELRKA